MMKNHESDNPVELESQFILRLPKEPANILRELLKTNINLKDRVSIKIDHDMRHGEVRIDHWLLSAKVVDLPTIIESLKTIDGKGFYKTADICQMLICRDEDDPIVEEESPQKTKKKDPYKVDKKHLWPHGITPPTKNVRKRRFRKTLKKKYVEAPEIEREVKRLLRVDNEAASVRWEVINEEDENKVNKGTVIKKEPVDMNPTMAEHDIFGGAVSDSEEEDEATMRVLDVDESSQNSADSNSVMNTSAETKVFSEFSNDIFLHNSQGLMQEMQYYDHQQSMIYAHQNLSKAQIEQRLEELKAELGIIRIRRQQQDAEIENIENHALRQRFQDILVRLCEEQIEKEMEQNRLLEMLKTAV